MELLKQIHKIFGRVLTLVPPTDWGAEKVAQLLDEFEQVGLLQRIKDENGRVWGFWIGSDNFTPPPSKKSHYKAGKRSLFSQGADNVQTLCTQGVDDVNTLSRESLTLGLGLTLSQSLTLSQGLKDDQEQIQQQPQEQNIAAVSSSKATPKTVEATATTKPQGRKRPVLPQREYGLAKTSSEDEIVAAAWRKELGYEQCDDGIWRPESERAKNGFTLKTEAGVWIKARRSNEREKNMDKRQDVVP